ncbi:MAG: zinc-dependent metalloprotease [Saprospiraceae bacterium]|nr:zinc-dependent metalloprotease [Saprospiraceae bacterium]
MKAIITSVLLTLFLSVQAAVTPGYFPYEWDNTKGKMYLYVDKLDQEFLYVNSLPAGIGSNDIGLDRGQIGNERVVKFTRSGNKILLVQVNYDYRAVSDDPLERKSVEQAFAQSVLWGFDVEKDTTWGAKIEITPFLLRDAHGVANRLAQTNQGNYSLDKSRCAMYLDRTKNFPKNTEFEATITFTGTPKGGWIRSVTPDPTAVTVRMHHSLVELPGPGYQPREFDPRSGYFGMQYADYATPIEESLVKRLITRHRLQKKDPKAAQSEPVEPIIYYLDPGCPEPIRSALLDGARWWNQAFTAAGYINAFQVKMLPADADPMDVRYNLIQWVHRSTRGWSYGASIVDPRTGEIIKGQVSLGSLRVRQDFLIAQALLSPYGNNDHNDGPLLEVALARLRQLAAHEVGHTLGLSHNFAASTNDRASVMDYPHPLYEVTAGGKITAQNAYDDKIGPWDKRTILYGYQDFPAGTDTHQALQDILLENEKMGLRYISDRDARSPEGANPYGHLWDSGNEPAKELTRLIQVRQTAMDQFGLNTIRTGDPLGTLENVFVPLYLLPRYQIEAVSKVIGGVNYGYDVKELSTAKVQPVSPAEQQAAMQSLFATLEPAYLVIPEAILQYLPPQPIGYNRDRELFKIYTGQTFDPLGAAESSAQNTLGFMLVPAKLARVIEQHDRFPGKHQSLSDYLMEIGKHVGSNTGTTAMEKELGRMTEKRFIYTLMENMKSSDVAPQVRAEVLFYLSNAADRLNSSGQDAADQAHRFALAQAIKTYLDNPGEFSVPEAKEMPDGSPIGMECMNGDGSPH